MSETKTSESEGVELLSGYSTKKLVSSVALACVLHVVVLSAYVILGSSKKPKATAEVKPEEKGEADEKSKATPTTKDDKGEKPASTTDTKDLDKDSKPAETKKSPDDKKSPEVAAPSEIPKSPDGDIDDIIKRK